MADRESQIAFLQSTVRALRLSTSWRITAPLRVAKRLLRRLQRYDTAARRLLVGAWRGDTKDDLFRNPDVDAVGGGPRAHLAMHGVAERGDPGNAMTLDATADRTRDSPAVDVVARSGLFDSDWYLEQYPEVRASGVDAAGALRHFIDCGASEGRDPNPFFSTKFYDELNPDVAETGLNPVVHYLQIGAARDADPSTRFHTRGYLRANPDVAASGLNPLQHFLVYGLRQDRNPKGWITIAPPQPVGEAQLTCWKQPATSGEVALFVTHSPDGHLKPHVPHYLNALRRHGIKPTLIIAADHPVDVAREELSDLVDGLYVRQNLGFDFAAWAHVLREAPKLFAANILYLLNDSVIGPLNEKNFTKVLHKIRHSSAAVVGLTDNFEFCWHIQSYFIAVKKSAMGVLEEFMDEVMILPDREDVISEYEITLTPAFREAGLAVEVLFPSKDNRNPTMSDWKRLIHAGLPFVKVSQLIRLWGAEDTGWRELLKAEGFDPDVAERTIGGDYYEQKYRKELAVIRNSKMFDEEWYKSKYPDVGEAGIDPVVHYILWGAAQGRDPCRHFSTSYYLKNNSDVVERAANPLVHYIEYGRNEGRQAKGDDYQSWVERFDSLSDAERAAIKSEMDRFSKRPLISVLMPVYNTDREWLIRAIESVRTQLYPNWELCISDDASTSPHVKEILDSYALIDRRIRVGYRDTNGHISLNSNSALALATGEFIALLDNDDELPSHALFWVAREIVQCPHVDLIYSDEDKIDVEGRRHDAYFKSDWNPALILSQNFFSHLGVYRRSLVQQVGGFRVGFEGSQDHDLVIRCADASAPERIRHIPRVLYHWRSIEGSTASGEAINAKPYAWQAGSRAIKEHLERHGIAADVGRALSNFYQVDYQVSARLPKVSIVIPTTGNLKLFERCIRSLYARTTYPDFEILIAINKSHYAIQERGSYLDKLRTDPRIRILVHKVEPYSFARVNNWAIQHATGSVICFLNDDIEVITPDWLEKLVMRLELERVGAVGPMLYYPDDTIQHAGVILGHGGVAGHAFSHLKRGAAGYFGRAALEQDLSCITAACMVMRRALFEELNGFTEELAIAFNDVDLCIRIRNAGWRIIWTPQVELYHHESASLGPANSPERKAQFEREVTLMRKMWGEVLDNDPFYNPNLSLTSDNFFTLAFPPRDAST